MNKYVKNFFLRGLIFSGLGPVVYVMVMMILALCNVVTEVSVYQVVISVISTYILAFVAAGSSVVHSIESWSLLKSTLIYGLVLYASYIVCYLLNNWINFNFVSILIFTGIFIGAYLGIWLSIFLSTRAMSKKLNEKLAIK